MGKLNKKSATRHVAVDDSISRGNMQPPQSSPFCSSIISVQVGEPPQVFRLHSDILSSSAQLTSAIESLADDHSLIISDISPLVFDLVVRHLYGTAFESWKSKLSLLVKNNAEEGNLLQGACEILCFALKYGFREFEEIVTAYIKETPQAHYQSVLAAAKYVYTHCSTIQPWFRDLIRSRTQEALADPAVADNTWFIDVFRHGYNGLSEEVFDCYKNVYRLSRSDGNNPVSEIDESTGNEPVSRCRSERERDSDEKRCQLTTVHDPWNIIDIHGESAKTVLEELTVCKSSGIASARRSSPDRCTSEQLRADQPTESVEEFTMPALELELEQQVKLAAECVAEERVVEECVAVERLAEEPSMEVQFRYESSNFCADRRSHLQKKARWERCGDCQQEVITMVNNVLYNS